MGEITVGLGPWESVGPFPKSEGTVALDVRDFMAHYGIRSKLRGDGALRVTLCGGEDYVLSGAGHLSRHVFERLTVRVACMRGVTCRAVTVQECGAASGIPHEVAIRAAESCVEATVEGCRAGEKGQFPDDAEVRLVGGGLDIKGRRAAYKALSARVIEVLADRQETAVSLKELPPFRGNRLGSPVDILDTLRRNWDWMRYLCDLSLAPPSVVAREVTGKVPQWSKKQAIRLFRALIGPWDLWTQLGLDQTYNGFDVSCCYVTLFRKQQGQARITADGPRYL